MKRTIIATTLALALSTSFAAAQSVTPTQPGSQTPSAQQNNMAPKQMDRDGKSDRSGMTTGSSTGRMAPGTAGSGNNGNSMGGSNSSANPSNSAGSGSGSAGMR